MPGRGGTSRWWSAGRCGSWRSRSRRPRPLAGLGALHARCRPVVVIAVELHLKVGRGCPEGADDDGSADVALGCLIAVAVREVALAEVVDPLGVVGAELVVDGAADGGNHFRGPAFSRLLSGELL